MTVPIITISVKVYDHGNFGDGKFLTTATELSRSLKGAYGSEGDPTREECAAELTDIDEYLNRCLDEDEIQDEVQSLLKEQNHRGWSKGGDWSKAKKYLKSLAK